MPAAVLFDWGDTLIRFVYDEALVEAGHRAGLATLGRDDLPEVERVATHFRERYEPLFWAPGTVEELEYPGLVRQLLGDFGLEVDDEELTRFLEAEHAAWDPARQAAANTPALLEALRARGLKLGLVSNAFDPGWLLHRDLEQMGLAERLDFAVFSSGGRRQRFRRRPPLRGRQGCRRAWDDHRAGALVPRRRASRGRRAGLPGVYADGRPERGRPARGRGLADTTRRPSP
ncbi:MAG: hypothetical protein AUG43_06065 [Actinobacteria bacterium 13_1_20CM_3_68_10]|nr:MAG: hypothetical protein AUG43_06065 [Actinobacteria bacterium 13_1_20CM_3_68_10]